MLSLGIIYSVRDLNYDVSLCAGVIYASYAVNDGGDLSFVISPS